MSLLPNECNICGQRYCEHQKIPKMESNEPPKEDKQLIGKIDEMLTQLNGFGKSLFELREHASLVLPDVAPIDTKEEVYCEAIPKCNKQCSLCKQEQAYLSQQGEQPNQIKEEVKERWQPSYGCKYWYIGSNDGQFFVSDFHWGNDDVDFVNHDTGNCFKTEQEAQLAADKIKALLQNI